MAKRFTCKFDPPMSVMVEIAEKLGVKVSSVKAVATGSCRSDKIEELLWPYRRPFKISKQSLEICQKIVEENEKKLKYAKARRVTKR